MSLDWPWEPLSPAEAAGLFADAPSGWCIAGGWAIDLFLGRQTRPHADTDVLVPRSWLGHLHEVLPGWTLYAAEGTLTLWEAGEAFPDSTSDIWCCRDDGTWRLQLMLGVETEREWVFRRDHRIRGPLDRMILQSAEGIPYLAPEIQLLYKAKLPNRPKDEADFRAALPNLDAGQRRCLADALAIVLPEHPWRAELLAITPGG